MHYFLSETLDKLDSIWYTIFIKMERWFMCESEVHYDHL